MRSALTLTIAVALFASAVSAQSQASKPGSGALAHSTQMIAVTTSDWNAVEGHLQRYERAATNQPWHPIGQPFPIVVGKNGLGWGIGVAASDAPQFHAASDPIKHEGDGKGPAGIFALGTAFGDAPAPLPGLKLPYLELTPSIECVDDTNSSHYNRIVDRATVAPGGKPDWHSSEHMRDIGEAYRWGIVVDLNGIDAHGNSSPPKPGAGSCVFLHIWHSQTQGTAGCTAMPESNLETLLTWLDPARKPLLVQLPQQTYGRVASQWNLPGLASVAQP